jgi:hypothetical protein
MLGRYELIQELAKSQIGPLWVAHVPGNEELVAIRRVSTSSPVTPDEKDALCEGAWWTLELQHPTIAQGKDVVMSDSELGIVTEYAEGEVLRSLLRLSSFKRKPIPMPAALRHRSRRARCASGSRCAGAADRRQVELRLWRRRARQ